VLNDGTIVATFSGRRAGSPVNFTASSGVFVSTDGGLTWADRSDPGMKYWTSDVVVDPNDPTQSTWLVGVYSGWGGLANNLGGLYKTTDRGQHWTKLMAFDGVTSATFNPNNPNELYVTTEDQGLWYSSNGSAAAPTLTQVASYPFRQPERVFFNPYNPNEVWVTSFGSGMLVGTEPTASAGSLGFGSANFSVVENAGSATITVTRTGGSTGAVSVHYATSDGTATAGVDYTSVSGTLNFADGQTSATFAVPIFDDPNPDGSETVNLALSSPTGGAALGSQAGAVLTITDVPGSLQFSATGYSVRGKAGGATITVTRTLGDSGAVTIHYATSDGTAKAGVDYTSVSADLPFADGQTSNTFTVPLLNNPAATPSETLTLTLSIPSGGASLGTPSTATLTLTEPPRANDDFDADGRTDPGVFRPSTAQWFVRQSTAGLLQPTPTFGATGLYDIPVAGDFDGVGHAEVAVFRPSTAQWFVLGPHGGHPLATFGATNLYDIPLAADFDGVGHAEPAVYRPSTGQWFVLGPSGGHPLATFGGPTDIPVAGDFDGVGHAEPAVFRPSTGQWFVLGPSGGHLLATFGGLNLFDVPVPGDLDGVGHAEPAVFRRSTAQWFVLAPGGGHLLMTFGGPNDYDVPIETSVGALVKLGAYGGVHGLSLGLGTGASGVSQGFAGPGFQGSGQVQINVPAPSTPRPQASTQVRSSADLDAGSVRPRLTHRTRPAQDRAAWLAALEHLAGEREGRVVRV
jgi:hypothetical protein